MRLIMLVPQKTRILTGNGETGDGLGVVEFEAESLRVVTQNLNLGKLEIHPVAVEDLGAVLELDRGGR